MVPLIFSGPFSQRITCGFPRQEMICFKARITRSLGSEVEVGLQLQLQWQP
jgi:hypothetical protein